MYTKHYILLTVFVVKVPCPRCISQLIIQLIRESDMLTEPLITIHCTS